ncbi:sugar nucleotide-binding protein [Spongiibacter sp. KMU-158]|uniref:dTDP-4-dehydrorhamnose reductase n=1 Tax=Spongiibacter pelagi TaxID=2760804 RepID=A0A927C256_9GAMM|nr:sugar nucleotide-binding protein [Spongiibacter pelagi]MBD2859359.1 sugar nucleotide-binding protein [Spongiibacter pelagi]
MSSPHTILISHRCAIAEALRLQYQSRGRAFIEVDAHQRAALSDAQLESAVIIDLSLSVEAGEASFADTAIADWQHFVERCAGRGSKYLLLSEGRVLSAVEFDQALHESAVPAPVDALGHLLMAAEGFLLSQPQLQPLVLRSGPIISTGENNLLAQCLELLRQEQPRILASQHRSCPTPAIDLARVLSAMTDQLTCGAECRGVYHYNSSGACSYYEFIEVVHAYAAQFLPAQSRLTESEAGESWSPWVPELSCQRLLGSFGIKQLPWRAWLPKLIKNLCEDQSK